MVYDRRSQSRLPASLCSMTLPHELTSDVRAALGLLANRGDRDSPPVFAGRESELALLSAAIRAVQRNEVGRTVVVEGVPGAGKTSLLSEHAGRLLSTSDLGDPPVIPVPLLPDDLDAPPAAIVRIIDEQFREFEASNEWSRRKNRTIKGATLLGHMLFAAFTKKDIRDFRPSATAPDHLPRALADYIAFRFDRRDSAIALLVDEAQNLNDTPQVRAHLRRLHAGIKGSVQVHLACFGLANTTDRLRALGLSRLASGHARRIGALSDEEAMQTVSGTLNMAFANHEFGPGSFDETCRNRWIDSAAATILSESANFPHHLANGCRALAEIILADGIGVEPPKKKLIAKCRGHRREYYDARLQPWRQHSTALSLAFADTEWTQASTVKLALMASDDHGDPVDAQAASDIVKDLCDNGYVELRPGGKCRPALPSLASHFRTVRQGLDNGDNVTRTVAKAISDGPQNTVA